MYRRILVPLDGTPLGERTAEQAVTFARAHGAEVLFLHAHPDFAATEEGALLHAMSPALFSDLAEGRTSGVLARAEATARAKGVESRSVAVVQERPQSAILEFVRKHQCDLVFMASHGRRGLLQSRLGKVTQAVLDAATVPVLVAAVEVNVSPDAQSRALDIIRAEHRSLGAVVHALQQHWTLVGQGAAPHFALMRAMLDYVEIFPERSHHPKEEAHLFARLRARTVDCNALLDKLEQQHADGRRLFQELRRLLAEVERGDEGARTRFGEALGQFVRDQLHHQRCEEQLVLPLAFRWLTPDDWEGIAAAFAMNEDPRFGADSEETFEQLADRLLRLASVNAVESSPSR
jgi:nucleotide-binding universal stress UspA family protein/hemerythrin-like domain-containing protein